MEHKKYFSQHHLQYIKDAAVTLNSGQQCLIKNNHGEQPLKTTPEEKVCIDFLHGAVGLATELGEMYPLDKIARDPVNLGEEISDCFWYLAIFDRHFVSLGMPLEVPKYERDILFEEDKEKLFELVVKDLLDVAKKNFIYGKNYDMLKVHSLVMSIHGCLIKICDFYGIDYEVFRDRNIAKLKQRYGDKFAAASALNRDTEAERRILEGEVVTALAEG